MNHTEDNVGPPLLPLAVRGTLGKDISDGRTGGQEVFSSSSSGGRSLETESGQAGIA